MATVNQPSALPTNKLTAAMFSAAVAAWIKALFVSRYPEFADPALWAPLPYVIGFLVGYMVKDAPNTAPGAPA